MQWLNNPIVLQANFDRLRQQIDKSEQLSIFDIFIFRVTLADTCWITVAAHSKPYFADDADKGRVRMQYTWTDQEKITAFHCEAFLNIFEFRARSSTVEAVLSKFRHGSTFSREISVFIERLPSRAQP